MRWFAAALLPLLVQTPATLPPPFPRPGVTKILDNDRVQVWNVSWPKGYTSPLHRHAYDLVGTYYEPGDRIITDVDGTKRSVSTKAWGVTFQRTGLTHIEEGVSDASLRAVFVEMKVPGAYGSAGAGSEPAFTGEGATRKLDNDRVTAWEFTQLPAPKRHRHAHDAVVVSFGGDAPKAAWVKQGTVHDADGDAGSHVFVFEIK